MSKRIHVSVCWYETFTPSSPFSADLKVVGPSPRRQEVSIEEEGMTLSEVERKLNASIKRTMGTVAPGHEIPVECDLSTMGETDAYEYDWVHHEWVYIP